MEQNLNEVIAYHLRRANAFHERKQYDEAMEALRQVFKLQPESPEAHFNMGNVIRDAGNPALAAEAFICAVRAAERQGRRYPQALLNLGDVYLRIRRFPAALTALGEAVQAAPQMAEAHMALGLVHYEMGDCASASLHYRNGLALMPDHPGLLNNYALALYRTGEYRQSLEAYHRLVAVAPDMADGRTHRALILLLNGDYQQGFAEYEWRWKTDFFQKLRFPSPRPEWKGEDLTGKTIIAYGEQGYGDVFQFARYLTLLAGLGARVIAFVEPTLAALIATVPGVAEVITIGDKPPPHDFHIPMLSLPGRFGTIQATIPAVVPYISPPAGKVVEWRGKLAHLGGYRVGVTWAGRPEHPFDHARSMPLETLAPLGRIPGITYVSLQQGPRADEPGLEMYRPGKLESFTDTAAIIQALDMVIAVDTSVIHLAGALGKQARVLIPRIPEWRWGLKGEVSPWYPSLRIVRQTTDGDWTPVVARLADDMRRAMMERASIPPP
jgi:Tfp pilus assembly protein PilF